MRRAGWRWPTCLDALGAQVLLCVDLALAAGAAPLGGRAYGTRILDAELIHYTAWCHLVARAHLGWARAIAG